MAGKKVTKEDIAAFLAELEEPPVTEDVNKKETVTLVMLPPVQYDPHFAPPGVSDDPRPSVDQFIFRRPSQLTGSEEAEARKRTESTRDKEKPADHSKIAKMKEFLGRPSHDGARPDVTKDDKTKKEASLPKKTPVTGAAPKPKLRSEFHMEVTDIHSKQKLSISLEDLGSDQVVGHLQVKHGLKNDWRLQYCVLDSTNLYIFKTTPDDKAWKIGVSKGFTVECVELEDLPACFKFTTPPDHTFFFQAGDSQERDVWVSALQKAMVSSVGHQVVRNSMRDDGIKGAIKVHGEALQQQDKSKAILVDTSQTSADVVKMVLQKFQVTDNPEKYGLFERTPEGEEYAINDNDVPLLVKTFWDSNGVQREFCIKEKYPNIGLFKHTLQRSDAFKNSPLARDIPHPSSTAAVELVDKSIGDLLRDPLFGTTDHFRPLPVSGSSSHLPLSTSGYDLMGSSSDAPDPGDEEGEADGAGAGVTGGAGSGTGAAVTRRERSDSKKTVKAPLRLSAFGVEVMELAVVG